MHFRFVIFFIACITLFTSCKSDSKSNDSNSEALTIFLVRHAEKDAGEDPALSVKGMHRANQLAQLLKDQNITYIFSTSYNRTLQTAAVVAKVNNNEVELYDTADLPGFAERLKEYPMGSTMLVVGHSNTTPVLINSLDPSKNYPQIDDADYENIFRVTVSQDGSINTEQLRFNTFANQVRK